MVSAQETSLQVILEGTRQYQVPLYQRTYSWTRKQLQRLWTDLETLADARRHTLSHPLHRLAGPGPVPDERTGSSLDPAL